MRATAMRWVLGLAFAVACGGRGSLGGPAAEAQPGPAVAPTAGQAGSVPEPRPAPLGAPSRSTHAAAPALVGPVGNEPALAPAHPSAAAAAATAPVGNEPALAPAHPSAAAAAAAAPTNPEPRPDALELVFVGDVVLGEYVFDGHRSFAGPLAPADPFVDVADLLKADVVVGNLESPVMHEIPEQSPLRYGHRFGASAPAVAALAAAGFTVMSVGNNHANDLGRAGLEQTPEVLRAAGITPVGEARHEGSPLRVVTLEHRGWRIGLLSATTWLNHAPTPGDPSVPVVAVSRLKRTLVPLVEQARRDHDLVLVLLHWGRERRERPEPAQIHAAHAFIDAGADLVIGHHPHVLQGIERYGNGLIAYSLGNFLFPAREEAFRDSAVLRVTVTSGCVAKAALHAVRLKRGFAPGQPSNAQREAIYERTRWRGQTIESLWNREGESCANHANAATR